MRELHEELGIEVHEAAPLIAYEHEYPHRRVLLDLWVVTRYSGEPQPLDAPALQWAADRRSRTHRLAGSRPADDPRVALTYNSRSKKRSTIS